MEKTNLIFVGIVILLAILSSVGAYYYFSSEEEEDDLSTFDTSKPEITPTPSPDPSPDPSPTAPPYYIKYQDTIVREGTMRGIDDVQSIDQCLSHCETNEYPLCGFKTNSDEILDGRPCAYLYPEEETVDLYYRNGTDMYCRPNLCLVEEESNDIGEE